MSTNDLTDRMLTGERILWSGRPAQGLLLTGQDIFLIPFSLVWCAGAVLPQTMLMTRGDWWGFNALFSAPFMLVGLYLILGRFLIDIWVRRGMQYAVTNKRILILRSGPFSKLTALNLDRLKDVSISESASGRGTIRFGEPATLWGRNNNISTPARPHASIPENRECPQRVRPDSTDDTRQRSHLASKAPRLVPKRNRRRKSGDRRKY